MLGLWPDRTEFVDNCSTKVGIVTCINVQRGMRVDGHRRLGTQNFYGITSGMCGIAGVLDWRTPPDVSELRAMVQALQHRGPDEQGVHLHGPVGLAHARLSIIDLVGGHQPMSNEDDTIWVSFNGEIFNHLELRADLERAGHRFKTHSDTEVLVHLYEAHGDAFVEHLNGQFAIALWDQNRERLVLARDRVGIRPLVYTQIHGRWCWASEAKALFALPEVPRRLHLPTLNEVFTFWSPLGDHHVFEGLHHLEPGHILTIDRQGAQVRCYWDWTFDHSDAHRDDIRLDDAVEQVRALMHDAVQLQLRSDVPVGAYLSGGLDSSIIASLVKDIAPEQLRTFSLTFDDPEFDESAYQAAMAQHLGTSHSSVRCTREDIATLFPQAVYLAEMPVLRTAPAPMLKLAQHARQSGYKVVLTGEGADETFCGYDIYREARIRRFMARQPQSKVRPLLLDRLYPYMRHSPAAARAMSRRYFAEGASHAVTPGFGHTIRWSTSQRIRQVYGPALREVLNDVSPLDTLQGHLPAAVRMGSAQQQDQYVEAHTLLSGYLLSSQGDRMAMGASIEGRYPFLDHRLVEWANRLPDRFKLMGLNEKFILKRAFASRLPAQITQRPKQPYRAPDSASFFVNGQLHPIAQDVLNPSALSRAGYFDPQAVGKLVAKCQAGRAIGFGDNMAFVGVLSTMLLHEQYQLKGV